MPDTLSFATLKEKQRAIRAGLRSPIGQVWRFHFDPAA